MNGRTAAEAMEEEKQRVQEDKRTKLLSLLLFSQQEYVGVMGSQTQSPSTSHQQTQTSQPTTRQQQQTPVAVRDFGQQTDTEAEQRSCIFRASIIRGDDSLTGQYTGLPSWGVFLHTVMFLTPFANQAQSIAITVEDEFFLTLVRLRLALFCDDLAFSFGVSVSTV